jgi:hypothetical protein
MECAECERDTRGGHDKSCSRYTEYCRACGSQIKVQVQKGTGFCSQNCQDFGPDPDLELFSQF